ncbi:MAG: cbb3-type cytochrome c oxidase N-terminal domain-containing protein, partial [Bacteroidota bacterium]
TTFNAVSNVNMAVVVAIVAVFAMFTLLTALNVVLKFERAEMGIEEEEKVLIPVKAGEEGVGFWRRFWNRVNDAVPVAREAEVATNHEYDGIRELDNRLPPWWLYGFYFSIAFAAIYLFRFYFLDMPKQDDEFQAEMLKAKEEVKVYLASLDNLIDENSVTLATETADLNAGKAIFEQNCAVCHASDGGGGVGPNLTDKYWLHGGDMPAIFSTVKYGVPSKGMIAWEAQLSPKKMQQVASYIYMMEGTTPAKAKDPQGDLFERVEELDEVDKEDSNPNAIDDEADLDDEECC